MVLLVLAISLLDFIKFLSKKHSHYIWTHVNSEYPSKQERKRMHVVGNVIYGAFVHIVCIWKNVSARMLVSYALIFAKFP